MNGQTDEAAVDRAGTKAGRAPGAGRALALLFSINLLNYIDRYVLAGVLPLLEREPAFGRVGKKGLGTLAPAFLVVYMLTSPIFGLLGDRVRRTLLVGVGVQLWSLATAAGGLARSFGQLFASRMFVGVGEAAYGTTAPTIISDLFVKQRRGSALSLFYVAIPVGSALGYIFGGLIGPPLGWRTAFFIVGLPGLLVGALAYRMAEPRRGASEEVAAEELDRYLEKKVGWRDYLALLGNRSYLLNTAGMTAFTYAIGGISYWIPTFLAQERGLPLGRANLMFGGITVVCGIVGTLAGGRLADRLAPRLPGAYFLVSGLGMLLAFPLFYLALRSLQPAVYWAGFAATELLLFLNTGPSNTVLVNVTAPRIRTTAFAINVLLIHALGDAISPVVMGAIADQSDLATAFRSTTLVVALSGVLWTVGARFYRRDSERVTQLMRGPGES